MANGFIGGALPFGGSAANVLRPGNVAGNYASAYKDALSTNSANYNNILKGFQDTAADTRAQQTSVAQGYTDLGNNVQNLLQGANASNISDINNKYAKGWAGANQRLTSSGLGNTTVVANTQRGFDRDRAAETTRSQNQFANTQAGYMSSIGQAGLGYRGNAINANVGQANRQLDWMNSVNAPYPSASAYAALAQMQGANRGGGGNMGVPPLPQGRGGYQGMPMGGMGGGEFGQVRGQQAGGQDQIGEAWNDFPANLGPNNPFPMGPNAGWERAPMPEGAEPPLFEDRRNAAMGRVADVQRNQEIGRMGLEPFGPAQVALPPWWAQPDNAFADAPMPQWSPW